MSGEQTGTDAMEVELVRRATGGDRAAFSALVKSYHRRVLSVAYRLLGNAEDAADVGQDTFVRAYHHLDQLDDPARFGPWLMRTASNLALNFRRSRARRVAASIEDEAAISSDARNPATHRPLVTSVALGDDALPDELKGAIDEALAKLPDKQRLALILFSVEGMSQKEVAEILECSIELVKWNVFKARKKLAEELEAYL